jgi:hypothetical protein
MNMEIKTSAMITYPIFGVAQKVEMPVDTCRKIKSRTSPQPSPQGKEAEEPLPGPPLKGRGQKPKNRRLLPSLEGRAGERFLILQHSHPGKRN